MKINSLSLDLNLAWKLGILCEVLGETQITLAKNIIFENRIKTTSMDDLWFRFHLLRLVLQINLKYKTIMHFSVLILSIINAKTTKVTSLARLFIKVKQGNTYATFY